MQRYTQRTAATLISPPGTVSMFDKAGRLHARVCMHTAAYQGQRYIHGERNNTDYAAGALADQRQRHTANNRLKCYTMTDEPTNSCSATVYTTNGSRSYQSTGDSFHVRQGRETSCTCVYAHGRIPRSTIHPRRKSANVWDGNQRSLQRRPDL